MHLRGFELISHPQQQDIYEDDWSVDERSKNAHARAMELYVLRERETWPMTTDDEDWSSGWERAKETL